MPLILFSLTLLCPLFFRTYPAVPLFFFSRAFTFMCLNFFFFTCPSFLVPYFFFFFFFFSSFFFLFLFFFFFHALPAVLYIFFSCALTLLRHYPALRLRVPCCALFFLDTYPAVQ